MLLFQKKKSCTVNQFYLRSLPLYVCIKFCLSAPSPCSYRWDEEDWHSHGGSRLQGEGIMVFPPLSSSQSLHCSLHIRLHLPHHKSPCMDYSRLWPHSALRASQYTFFFFFFFLVLFSALFSKLCFVGLKGCHGARYCLGTEGVLRISFGCSVSFIVYSLTFTEIQQIIIGSALFSNYEKL